MSFYSAQQDSENDDNKNVKYPALDESIRQTYAARSKAGLLKNYYDSYIRAIRWATNSGIPSYSSSGMQVVFVTSVPPNSLKVIVSLFEAPSPASVAWSE